MVLLREVFVYGRFLLEGFDWENFGVFDKWSFMGGAHLRHMVIQRGFMSY